MNDRHILAKQLDVCLNHPYENVLYKPRTQGMAAEACTGHGGVAVPSLMRWGLSTEGWVIEGVEQDGVAVVCNNIRVVDDRSDIHNTII